MESDPLFRHEDGISIICSVCDSSRTWPSLSKSLWDYCTNRRSKRRKLSLKSTPQTDARRKAGRKAPMRTTGELQCVHPRSNRMTSERLLGLELSRLQPAPCPAKTTSIISPRPKRALCWAHACAQRRSWERTRRDFRGVGSTRRTCGAPPRPTAAGTA